MEIKTAIFLIILTNVVTFIFVFSIMRQHLKIQVGCVCDKVKASNETISMLLDETKDNSGRIKNILTYTYGEVKKINL
jgi:D-ribose pyranose/furanose isomerase RbsD